MNNNNNNEYIYINNNDQKIYICVKCNRYIIYIKGNFSNNNNCPHCHYPHLHHVFASEAKIYFNPKDSDRPTATKIFGKNYRMRYFSKKNIQNMDSEF